ncbi:hypothetical protein MKX01_039750 [Papaver californicum]|nr:hypothetical protein MKX01_039750 [Papaver californicum]
MRNTSLAFSRHCQSDNFSSVPYEILNHDHDDSNGTSWTEKNRRKKEQVVRYMMSSMSYKRDRAKNRQIFLKSYKVTHSIETKSIESDNNSLNQEDLQNLVLSSFRSCAVSGPPAIYGSSPTSMIQPVHRTIRK